MLVEWGLESDIPEGELNNTAAWACTVRVLNQQPGKPCTTTTCKVATYVWMSARVLLTLESTPRRMAVTRLLALWVARYVRY